MNDNIVNLALIGRLIRRRWLVLVVLAVLGGLSGAGASLVLSPGYLATSKVLLQGERDQKALPGEAQIATSLIVLDRTAEVLDWGVTGTALQRVVSAAVGEGNVIVITGTASTPMRAQQLTEQATTEYINFSAQIISDTASATATVSQQSRDAVQQRIDEANQRVTELQNSPVLGSPAADGVRAREELDRQRRVVAEGIKKLDTIDSETESAQLVASLGRAGMLVIEPAVAPAGPASPTPVELIVVGACLFVLAGLFAHLLALRVDRRLQTTADISAAAGAPVLAAVEIAATSRSWMARLLHDDRRWVATEFAVSDDDRSRGSRYRRVLGRLTGNSPLSVLVLVPDDDPVAREAVIELTMSAATGRERVLVTTDSDALAEAVRSAAHVGGMERTLVIEPRPEPGETPSAMVWIVEISAVRPAVPDAGSTTRTVLVVTVGTRTGWELAGISGACSDAGQRIAGVLVAVPRFRGGRTVAGVVPKTPAVDGADVMAVSA